jgi:Domain of unknown function (DUF4416)
MGNPKEPKPAKYFVALLSSDHALLNAVEPDLSAILGEIDGRSETLPWTVSKFYEKEMGAELSRRFLSFSLLLNPGHLPDIKLQTQRIEDKYRKNAERVAGRRINVDPGYVEAGKVVLASTKNAGHRIYLASGIYGEITLLYYDGAFHQCTNTYPDYAWPATLGFLTSLRSVYLAQLRQMDKSLAIGV